MCYKFILDKLGAYKELLILQHLLENHVNNFLEKQEIYDLNQKLIGNAIKTICHIVSEMKEGSLDENQAASRGLNCLLSILKVLINALTHKMINEQEEKLLAHLK